MTYAETLDFLYARLATFHRQGNAALNPSLDKTEALLRHLGHPERRLRTLHVAGTNGKGSVSHMLASILIHSGLRVGLYTSPHLLDFTERIRVNGQPCPPDFVTHFVAQHRALIDEMSPSFFELATAMAFQHFAAEHVEVAVIEVGLGGRWDSTNVITPELSVITNIGWDHAEILGDTLAKIAREKAGILKPGIPAVVGEVLPETRPIFDEAAAHVGAPLTYAQETFQVDRHTADWRTQALKLHHRPTGQTATYELDLVGDYQTANAATVLQAVTVLRGNGWIIPEAAVSSGLCSVCSTTGLRGRMEVLGTEPLLLADVAHNREGLRSVLPQFMAAPADDRHIVFGVVQEKDLSQILPLLPHENVTYYFVRPNSPRGLDERVLQDVAEQYGLIGAYYPSVAAGLKAAKAFAAPTDAILITGSTFVVAEALEAGESVSG